MDATIQESLFPDLVPAVSPTENPLATAMDRYRHWSEVGETQGGLLPQEIIPDLLGVSRQRVYELVKLDRLKTFRLFGKVFITGDSFAEYARSERKAGRPIKASNWKLIKAGIAAGREVMK